MNPPKVFEHDSVFQILHELSVGSCALRVAGPHSLSSASSSLGQGVWVGLSAPMCAVVTTEWLAGLW